MDIKNLIMNTDLFLTFKMGIPLLIFKTISLLHFPFLLARYVS